MVKKLAAAVLWLVLGLVPADLIDVPTNHGRGDVYAMDGGDDIPPSPKP